METNMLYLEETVVALFSYFFFALLGKEQVSD